MADHYSRNSRHCSPIGGREGPVSRDESEDLPERVLIKELSGKKVMIKRSLAYIIPSHASRTIITASLVILCSLMPLQGTAQDMFTEDTVNIMAVTVTATASVRHSPYTVIKIDSAVMARHEGSDLATLLQSASLLSVKRYGNSGLASVSIRGLSGSHTMVTWNGLSVNSPGNGYSDFAIIPLFAATTVKVTSGGSDLDDIAGAIGGKVELSSEPVFNDVTDGSLTLGTGSYGEYSSSATFRSGTDDMSVKLSLWGTMARNDFRYINSNAPEGSAEERRVNASYATGGITADLARRFSRSLLSAHIWYNDADRELPGPVTTVQQDFGERQRDKAVRSVLKYSLQPGRLTADISAGGSYDVNLYYNEVPQLNGENGSETYMVRTRIGYRLTDRMELILNAGDEYQRARSLSYQTPPERNVFSASLAARYNPADRLRLLLQARQMAVSGMNVMPEFTAGATWLLSGSGEHLLKASFSRNTKIPCMNDLYWVPGGNNTLSAETATGGEASWSFVRIATSGFRNTLDLTLHASRVENLIQWLPGESGLWSAENVRSVNVSGAEARLGSEVTISEWYLKGYLNYAFTRSLIGGSELPNDRSVGKQLVYSPLHHLNMNIDAGWNILRAGITAVIESRRYTTSDNSEWLPASFTTDMFMGTSFSAGTTRIRGDFMINNVLNTHAESVRNYPMPLRTFNLRLTLTWSDKPKNYENTL